MRSFNPDRQAHALVLTLSSKLHRFFIDPSYTRGTMPVLRERLRAAAPHAVHTLTWAHAVDDLQAIFRQTIAQAATRPARHTAIVKTRSDHAPL